VFYKLGNLIVYSKFYFVHCTTR